MTGDQDARLDEIASDFLDALRSGARPSIDAIAGAHPELDTRLRELLPMLAAMEGLKLDAPADREVPERIGDYTVERLIGSGGMGRVFEARDAQGHPVAIKVVHSHLLRKRAYVVRILREAQAGLRIDHPNVVRTLRTGMYESGDELAPFVAMEFIQGQTLAQLIEEVGPVPERLVRHIGESVASALAAVHAAGVIHRDVKPENVVITPEETIKLMDLGVAKLDDEVHRLSQTGEFVGSLLYAAPEQLRGGAVDARADLYALGLTLYELLTGIPVRVSTGAQRFDLQAALGPAPSLRTRREDVSAFLEALVGALLDTDPAQRPDTAGVVQQALASGEDSAWWQQRQREASRGSTQSLQVEREAPLRGREDELAALDAVYADATEGRGLTLVLEGEEGIGKTRLLREWLDRRAADSVPPRIVVVTRDAAEGGVDAFGCAFRTNLGRRALRERLEALLGDTPDLLADVSAHLGGDSHSMEPQVLTTVYVRLARALTTDRPLVVAIDDAHRLLSAERAVLAALSRACKDVPMLLLVAQRPRVGEGDRMERAAHLRVGALGAAACQDLLRDVLHRDGGRLGSAAAISERVDGNPFFLLEFLRHEARTRASQTSESLHPQIPDSLRDMIRARVDRLAHEQRDLLEVAACVGDVFDPVTVTTVCGIGRIQGLKRFGRLQRADGPLTPHGRLYRFRHRLFRDVLYEDLHPSMREAFHLEIAAHMEAHDESADARCRHRLLGGDLAGACAIGPDVMRDYWTRDALDDAAELVQAFLGHDDLPRRMIGYAELIRGALLARTHEIEEVRTSLERAIRAADGERDAFVSIRARLELGEALLIAGGAKEAFVLQGEAETLARAAGDTSALAASIGDQGRSLGALGETARAREVARESLELSEAASDRYQASRRAQNLAVKYTRIGDLTAAEPLFQRAIEHAQASGNRSTELAARTGHAGIRRARGFVSESLERLDGVLAKSREFESPPTLSRKLNQLGITLRAAGRFEEALPYLEQCRTLTEAYQITETNVYVLCNLVLCHLERGRPEEATPHLEALVLAVADTDILRIRVRSARVVAAWHLVGGRADEAMAEARSGRRQAERLDAHHLWSGVAAEEARILAAVDRWDEAYDLYRRVVERGDLLGYSVFDIRLAWAAGLVAQGRDESARGVLQGVIDRANDPALIGVQAHARLLGAAVSDADPMAARVAFERVESRVPYFARMTTHALLGRSDAFHAERASAMLDPWLAQFDAADRARMEVLPLYARVRAP